jgi:hypothetical protein
MRKIVLIFLLFSFSVVKAQYQEVLSSDRPGQALSANVVGKNVFQIQAGIDFFESTSNFYPGSYFRYGLSERFELNTGFILTGNELVNDIESFTLGARYLLSKTERKFTSALQLTHDFGAENKNTQLSYILASAFTDKLSYTINLGLNLSESLNLNNAIYIFNLSYALNDKVGVFIEPFGTIYRCSFNVNVDSGVYYLLNNNFQLDSVIGYNDGVFVGAGFTWRLPTKKN